MFQGRILSLCFALCTTVYAFAGPSSSGGGPGIVCSTSDNKITSAQSYDLYEGSILFNIAIIESTESFDIQINHAIQKLKSYNYFIGADFENAILGIRSKISFLPDGVVMGTGVYDLGNNYPPVVPMGCSLEYVGFYQTDGTLKISKTVFEKMSPTSQAALLTHEAFYKMARTFSNTTDSENARRFTSALLGNMDLNSLNSIASNLTWNESRFYWSSHLQQPIHIAQTSDTLNVKFSNPLNRNLKFEVECKDENLQSASQPSNITTQGSDTTVQLPYTTNCKLLKIVRHLEGTTTSDWGKLTDVKITVLSNNQSFLEIQSTPFAESEGNVYEEFNFPIYR